MFRAFHVCLKLQKHCKYHHFLRSTRQKCCNLQCFFAWLSKTLELQCFVHLGSKKYWYLQHCLRFCMAPANDVKTQKCCNLQHFVTSEKLKSSEKCVKTGPAWGYVGPSWGYVGLCLCAQSVVIYSILRCEMARTRVNTTVLVRESG